MRPRNALWRFVLAALASIVLLIVVVNVIQQPIGTSTWTYSAEFTDVSGLHEGADVRVRGVRVGKVETIQLKRSDKRSVASVTFTLEKRFSIVPASRLAIKFQALTGLRYMDVANPAEGNSITNRITSAPTTMTQPSFDITVLFNGLQPVLATINPDEINSFYDNTAAFLAGNGSDLGPMLDSIRKLTALVSDREQVIATIVRNLAVLAEGTRGHSKELSELLKMVEGPIDTALTVLGEFRKTQEFGPQYVDTVLHLLDSAGIKPGIDINAAFDKAFTNVYDNIEAFKRIPVIWENIQPPPQTGTPIPCSRGRAELPLPMDVLLNGRKVVLCNQS
jgi:phospholipid/cholesterol/gamma-HCH transport system substrate-binding protein